MPVTSVVSLVESSNVFLEEEEEGEVEGEVEEGLDPFDLYPLDLYVYKIIKIQEP